MFQTLSQKLAHERCQDSSRADRAAWCDEHVYKATIRQFANGVEISVKDIQQERLKRAALPEVPIHLQELKERTEEEQQERDEENRRRAGRRAKQTVRWLLKSMQADHLLTLTYRDIVDDIEVVKGHWQRFVRLVRKRYPKWQYVCVQELQERGSWHMHIAIRGRGDVYWLRRCWLMSLGHRVHVTYDLDGKKRLLVEVEDNGQWRQALPSEVAGNIDLRGPAKRFGGHGASWKTEKLAAYMTKYIAKTFEEKASGRRYWPSKEIRRPEVQKIWLQAQDWRDAVKECHDKARHLYSCATLHIWSSDDLGRIWVSGSEVVCPF